MSFFLVLENLSPCKEKSHFISPFNVISWLWKQSCFNTHWNQLFLLIFEWKLHFCLLMVHLPHFSLLQIAWLHLMESEVLCAYIVINTVYKFSGCHRQRILDSFRLLSFQISISVFSALVYTQRNDFFFIFHCREALDPTQNWPLIMFKNYSDPSASQWIWLVSWFLSL